MISAQPDLYAILGLSPQATQDQIGHAYRLLLRQHHPDTREHADPAHTGAADAALQQVLAAYTVLGDPDRRADYDRRTTPRPARRSLARQAQTIRPAPSASWPPPIWAGPVRWHR